MDVWYTFAFYFFHIFLNLKDAFWIHLPLFLLKFRDQRWIGLALFMAFFAPNFRDELMYCFCS